MHVSTKNQIENHVSPRIIRFYVQSPDFCYAAPPLSVTSVLCWEPWLAVNFMEVHPHYCNMYNISHHTLL